MLDKTYNPRDIEDRIYTKWVESGAFRCGRRSDAPAYSIVIPPPNVTGTLHMGHALDNTLQDVLVRFHRLRGYDVLWQPGTDHAGIATQMVVERNLAEEGLDRREMGREEFVRRVWEWKETSGGQITGQLRRLGASCDWERERFTLDKGLSAAVAKVFVTLYNEGLIYRDRRLVNWDPKLLTAISDLEVDQREVQGHLWHIRYPIAGEDGRSIIVATTRPETMLGDTGVAVHPDDPRYQDLIGKHALLPLVGRKLPIVADEHADPEQGSGAVKITPAHDFNDFAVGERHGLEMLNIFDQQAHLNEAVPEAYRGLERFAARERIVADLEAEGVLEKIEDHAHTVPYGDRSGVVIEPWLTDQWFVDAKTLAEPAIKAVKNGDTRFVPANWEKTYFHWMENIQPWCISRQLWWGHRIPAWYGPDNQVFVAETFEEAAAQAREHYGEDGKLKPEDQDEDVLDTWFSSALWPFSTLGWPEDTPELKRYYPTTTLVTGFDIIFFWVARMMMMGLHFMRDVPFKTVYIHGLVRDPHGQKMSKSKGNVVDPLEFMDKYGADALRFTMAVMETQGRDIKLSESRVEGYRNFGTKLWNAARLTEMYDCDYGQDFDPGAVSGTLNRWIVGEVAKTEARIRDSLDAFRFNDAAAAIYHFVWHSYCDWYLEFIKPVLMEGGESDQAETRATAAWALDQILILLHPFMPFITEALWDRLRPRDNLLILADWPDYPAGYEDEAVFAEIDWVIRLITEVRAVRAEMNVPAGARIPLLIQDAGAETRHRIARYEAIIARLARLDSIETHDGPVPEGAVQIVLDEATVILPLADVIDIEAEKARLQKEIEKTQTEIAGLDKRLDNPGFLKKAPAAVVEETRERRAEFAATEEKLKSALARLG